MSRSNNLLVEIPLGRSSTASAFGSTVAVNSKRVSIIAGLGVVSVVAATYWLESKKDHGLRPLTEVLWAEGADGKFHPPGSDASNHMLAELASRGTDIENPEYMPMVLIRLNALDSMNGGDVWPKNSNELFVL